MAEDKKSVERNPGSDDPQSSDRGKGARKRAPDQDVLPGILGKQLKAAYGDLLNAPIPDAFTELIKRLESQEPTDRQAKPDKPRREESNT
jgi:hypothetical protein